MSDFWSGWIIILTLGNIFFCYWLIRWTAKPRPGESAVGETTGHQWDGLEEYNNPMPRWWLWMFYITIVFGLAYLTLYPGLGKFGGMLGWTEVTQYEAEVDKADAEFAPIFKQYASTPVTELANNPEAVSVGRRLFLNYCAVCHGSSAKGAPGFPNLSDKDWLYGGTPEAIKTSILNGRGGNMPPMGAAVGGEEGIDQVAAYVMSLSGREVDPAKAEAGKAKFVACAACHGMDGTGNQMLGAPNLTDNTWLYGGSPKAIQETIRNGRRGMMPAHKDFLGEDKSHLLATYVYSLSNQ
jgi:cytochrome c oxidase cbb3-type subunit 3